MVFDKKTLVIPDETVYENNHIQVTVLDNGVGFDKKKLASLHPNPGGFGLFSIRERLSYIGGTLEIVSERDKGAEITMTAPLAVQEKDMGGKSK